MNDEYLWQKTGEDPETMELEKALAVFRYREDDPPAVAFAEAPTPARRWRFALAFAAPAFAAAVIAAVVWFPIGSRIQDSDVTFVNQTDPVIHESPALDPSPVAPPQLPARQSVRRVDLQPTIASLKRRPAVKAHSKKTDTAVLTKEERYAYQQLMLALSISSSKLNVVRDAINGVEDTNDAKQNNR